MEILKSQGCNTRASDAIGYIDVTATFGLKSRIKIVGGNRAEVVVYSFRDLCVGEQDMARLRETEATNVTETNVKEVREGIEVPIRSAVEKGV